MGNKLFNLKNIKDGWKWPVRVLGSMREAFEVKRLHEELLVRTPNGFVHIEVITKAGEPIDLRFIDANPAFEKATGVKAREIKGKSCRKLFPKFEEEWYQAYAQVAKSGKPVTFERYTSQFNAFYKVSAIKVGKGQVAVLFTDNTTSRRMEEMLALGWVRTLEIRDEETEGHSERVVNLTVKLAARLGFEGSQLQYVKWGALLHDIGKMGLPDFILKKRGRLTRKEREIMKKHPVYAERVLGMMPIKEVREIPFCHHEKWDGTGYPLKLKEKEIPLSARIFSVIDVWDALTSKRRYHEAWSRSKALEYIESRAGKDFDPDVVAEFVIMMKESRKGNINGK